MTDGAKFIGIFGVLSVGSCLVFSAYFFAAEYLARAELPIEMQSPEMIQKHFDGEVVLLSLTFAHGLLFLAIIFSAVFLACFALFETLAKKPANDSHNLKYVS